MREEMNALVGAYTTREDFHKEVDEILAKDKNLPELIENIPLYHEKIFNQIKEARFKT
jgi:predicted component of type VI protein secretion system